LFEVIVDIQFSPIFSGAALSKAPGSAHIQNVNDCADGLLERRYTTAVQIKGSLLMSSSLISVFFTAFGGTGFALLVAGYLGRRFMDVQVARAIEKYKAELDQKSAVLKTELSIYAHEQNVGLSRLDEQRSQAIQAIYGLMMKWHDIFLEITQPKEPDYPKPEMKSQRYLNLAQNLVGVANDLSIKVRDTAIFFQQESYEVIAKFGMVAMDLGCAFYDSTFGKVDMSKEPNYKELFAMIEKEREVLRKAAMKEDFDRLRELLVAEFRKLMKAERSKELTSTST
jgi:hypothetical protein